MRPKGWQEEKERADKQQNEKERVANLPRMGVNFILPPANSSLTFDE